MRSFAKKGAIQVRPLSRQPLAGDQFSSEPGRIDSAPAKTSHWEMLQSLAFSRWAGGSTLTLRPDGLVAMPFNFLLEPGRQFLAERLKATVKGKFFITRILAVLPAHGGGFGLVRVEEYQVLRTLDIYKSVDVVLSPFNSCGMRVAPSQVLGGAKL
jgi:hypothetical protein